MGNRKESLKKALGITEYPWSSDDDDEITPCRDMLQRSSRPRPSIDDLPGTSGVQQQQEPQPQTPPEQASPGAARRIQARMDRDLFWSIINNTPRSNNAATGQQSRSRATGQAMCPTPKSSAQLLRSRIDNVTEQRGAPRRPERPTSSADVQRILAFKKLTRSLQNLAQSKATASGAQRSPASTHSSPRAPRPPERAILPRTPTSQGAPSRSTLFSASLHVNRDLDTPRVSGYNYNPPWRRSLPAYPNDVQSTRLSSEPWLYGHPDSAPPAAASNLNNLLPTFSNTSNINDDGIRVPQPIIQKVEPSDETNENPEEETNESESAQDESGSGARLIEEVVEVEGGEGEGADNNPPPPGTEPQPAHDNNTHEATNSEENAETAQDGSTYQGVKRKREWEKTTDEPNETFSVHEFNQNLLRLLECPVCLEWMEPPISQCRRGHLVCSRCRARLAACPVCRTPFSSVRNRAMEGVAEMLRYPCRHGCGREVRLRRRAPHEASCVARRYHCPAPPCARLPPLPRSDLAQHFQCKHLPILKIGNKHKFSMKVNSEQHDTWLIMALDEYFHLRVDVDIRTWGVIVYVAYIGPKRNAKYYTYEVTVEGQHNSRKLVYTRSTHSDLESSSLNVSRQDCFHLTLDQALNFLRFKNRHCEPDKFLDFDVGITKWDPVDDSKDDSES